MFRMTGFACIFSILSGFAAMPALAQNAGGASGFALVIAQAENQIAPAPLADRDAGLIATALAKKGYSVTAARNLDSKRLSSTLADFKTLIKEKPDVPVFVYLGGKIIQSAQDNFLLPSDLTSIVKNDLQSKGVSINALMVEIGQLTLGPKFFVIDGARLPPKVSSVPATSSGLAIPQSVARTSVLINQSPGMMIKDSEATYRPFVLAISEAIATASLPRDIADFAILRTFELSGGQQIPWAMIEAENSGKLFAAESNLPPLIQTLRSKPKSALDATQGFAAALMKGSVISYEEYNLIHIQNPMTNIAREIFAALRDAQIWKEANTNPSASGYWSYLNLYPRGLHANEARAALKALGKTATPSPDEPLIAFNTTPPSHDELTILSQLTPYRLDETSPDLAAVATMIKQILPAFPNELRNMAGAATPASLYDLPLPPMDTGLARLIQRPQSVPDMPIIKEPEPAVIKQTNKPTVPVPPRRLSNGEQSEQKEEPALITITIPAPTTEPVAATPKSRPQRPTSDVFDQSFGSSSGEQNLPY